MAKILVRWHDEHWQVVLGESVVMVSKTMEVIVISAVHLHITMLRESLMSIDDDIELGEGINDTHIRAGYELARRPDLYQRRARTRKI